MGDYLANAYLDHSIGDGSVPTVSASYLGLSTAAITPDMTAGSVTSPVSTWTNYARQALAAANFAPASDAPKRKKTNVNAISYGTAVCTANTTITHWFITDASSGDSNILWCGEFATPIIVQNGQPVSIPAAALILALREAFAAISF